MIASFLPTSTEATHTITAAGYILGASGTLAVFCILCALAIDRYEGWRQQRLAVKDAEREAWLMETEDEAYIQHAITTASDPSVHPWPPVRRSW